MKLTPKQIKKFLNDEGIKESIEWCRHEGENMKKGDDEYGLCENEVINDIGELLRLDNDDISKIKFSNMDFLVGVDKAKKHLKENTPFIF